MRLFKCCVIIWFSCIFAIGIFVVVGRQRPLPEEIALLHLDECELPCWIGIVPGKTTFSEAQRQIQRVYGKSPYHLVHTPDDLVTEIWQDNLGEIMWIKLEPMTSSYFERAPVTRIRLVPYASSSSVAVGQVLSLVGMPTDIGLAPTYYSSAPLLFSRNRRVSVFVNESATPCTNISATDSIDFLLFSDGGPTEAMLRNLYSAEDWQGFKACYDFSGSH